MRRFLSLLVSLSLIISLVPAAFAASDEATTAANKLYELGLFGGTGTDANGSPVFDLDRAPTRHEAITMLVRLLGKTNEAESGTWNTPFTDVADWAKPYVGYAYTNGLAGGTSATTFSGNDTVSASQYLTFVLRALGYESGTDFQWNKTWELSDKIGLTDGRYNASTTNFTRGDVAIISYNSLSIPHKSQSEKDASKLEPQQLSGQWFGQNSKNGTIYMECYQFTDSNYSCAFRAFDSVNETLIASGYEEGTFCIHNSIIDLSYTKRYQLPENSRQTQVSNETGTNNYQIAMKDGDLSLDSWSYIKLDDNMIATFPIYETIKDEIMSCLSTKPSADAGYGYLAVSDFGTIRRQYSQAVAQCGYALAYTDLNGDSCVLTTVQYKIISNYSVTTLHNLTQDRTITDPAEYYNTQARRAYGGSKIRYWDLSNEVLTHYQEMLKAMVSVLESGTNTGSGIFVDAATLNQ